MLVYACVPLAVTNIGSSLTQLQNMGGNPLLSTILHCQVHSDDDGHVRQAYIAHVDSEVSANALTCCSTMRTRTRPMVYTADSSTEVNAQHALPLPPWQLGNKPRKHCGIYGIYIAYAVVVVPLIS